MSRGFVKGTRAKAMLALAGKLRVGLSGTDEFGFRAAKAGWDALKRTPTTAGRVDGHRRKLLAGVGAWLVWEGGGAGVQVEGGAGYLGGLVA